MARRSTSIDATPRRVAWVVLFALGLTAGCKPKNPVKSGDEVFSTLEEEVLSVSLQRSAEQVVASRNRPSGPFQYRFDRAGVRSECTSTPELDAALKQTFQVRAEQSLDDDAFARLSALPAEKLIELVVKGPGKAIEPFRLSLVAGSDPKLGQRVEAFLREYRSAFSVNAHVIDLWRLSCPTR